MAPGLGHGASVSRTRRSSRSSPFRSSERRTRTASLCAARAISSLANSAQTAAGARATRRAYCVVDDVTGRANEDAYRPVKSPNGSSTSRRRWCRRRGRPCRSCTQNIRTRSRSRPPSASSCPASGPCVFPLHVLCIERRSPPTARFPGRVVGPGSYRGRLQQELRHLIPQLQVLLHDLDARQGSPLPGGPSKPQVVIYDLHPGHGSPSATARTVDYTPIVIAADLALVSLSAAPPL